jgi:glycosyltransferase involved in cell wall biosynthesis
VYVGTLHRERLDVSLVARLAQALPAHVVLVGPIALDAAGIAELRDAGVALLGPRPYAEIPAYLQHAGVVVVPHLVNDFTESLDPIKAYECLAVGRPTVTTPVAGLRDLGEPVHVVGPDGFVAAVSELLAAPRPTVVVDVPTWRERALAFAEALRAARA